MPMHSSSKATGSQLLWLRQTAKGEWPEAELSGLSKFGFYALCGVGNGPKALLWD